MDGYATFVTLFYNISHIWTGLKCCTAFNFNEIGYFCDGIDVMTFAKCHKKTWMKLLVKFERNWITSAKLVMKWHCVEWDKNSVCDAMVENEQTLFISFFKLYIKDVSMRKGYVFDFLIEISDILCDMILFTRFHFF